jgi:hypothetical protein
MFGLSVVWAYDHLQSDWMWMQEQWAFEEYDDCVVHDTKAFLAPVSTSPQDTELALLPLESVQQRFIRA